MLIIKEVKTKKEIKQFINFPNILYKDNPNYVPALYLDELKLFTKKNPYLKTCDYKFYLAVRDNQVVGRIGIIIQKAYNNKTGEKRARFTRFHCINDLSVAKALLTQAENYAEVHGMDTICGPLGFSDLEREGLLIEGFDYLSTFEEEYNFDYYQSLIEQCGYIKEVDWLEHRLFRSDNPDDRLQKVSLRILQRYNLKIADCKSTNEFIKRYGDKLFDLLDKTYENLYQTVPFTKEMKDSIISTFKIATDIKHTNVIVDENDNVVCFGVSFPSLSESVKKCHGRLIPFGVFKLLKEIKHPNRYDLGLIGIEPRYAKTGVAGVLIFEIQNMLQNENIEYIETNLNLEDNQDILNCWKRFNHIQHKRRRSYHKIINKQE